MSRLRAHTTTCQANKRRFPYTCCAAVFGAAGCCAVQGAHHDTAALHLCHAAGCTAHRAGTECSLHAPHHAHVTGAVSGPVISEEHSSTFLLCRTAAGEHYSCQSRKWFDGRVFSIAILLRACQVCWQVRQGCMYSTAQALGGHCMWNSSCNRHVVGHWACLYCRGCAVVRLGPGGLYARERETRGACLPPSTTYLTL